MSAFQQGDYARAATLCREAVDVLQDAGMEPMLAQVLTSLGLIIREQGDNAGAATVFAESLRRMPPKRESWWTAATLEWTAGLVSTQGCVECAARLLGAADALRAAIGVPLSPVHRSLYDRDLTAVCAALGDEGFQAAWREGRAMTMEQAITDALEGLSPAQGTLRGLQQSLRDSDSAQLRPWEQKRPVSEAVTGVRLSRTERQTRALEHLRVVGALSPREYAALLEVSEDTALRDLRELVDRCVLQAAGKTRDRRYLLVGEAVGPAIHRTV